MKPHADRKAEAERRLRHEPEGVIEERHVEAGRRLTTRPEVPTGEAQPHAEEAGPEAQAPE